MVRGEYVQVIARARHARAFVARRSRLVDFSEANCGFRR
jgi:hypothetical protein